MTSATADGQMEARLAMAAGLASKATGRSYWVQRHGQMFEVWRRMGERRVRVKSYLSGDHALGYLQGVAAVGEPPEEEGDPLHWRAQHPARKPEGSGDG